jgi:hypothetical protein
MEEGSMKRANFSRFPFYALFLFATSCFVVFLAAGEPNPPNKDVPALQQTREEEVFEPLPDKDIAKPLPGVILFLNFAYGSVGYAKDGTAPFYKLAAITDTNRGNGKAVAAGLSFGLLGFATLPAIYAANANGLKPDETYDMLAFFPDGDTFLLSSPLAQKSFQYDFSSRKLRKFRFGGCDPEIMPDGKTLFIGPLSHNKNGKIASYDLASGKQLDFTIGGTSRQWWPRHSHDGKKMVFLEGPFETACIVLYDLETKEKRIIVSKEACPVHPCWSSDGTFIVYASLIDRQLHKLVLSTGEDIILTSSPYFKLYPVIGNGDKAILFSQAQLDVRSGSVGGRFRLKWLDLESKEIFTVPLTDPPKFFSAVQPHWWLP